jgi:acetyl-CoA synthetase
MSSAGHPSSFNFGADVVDHWAATNDKLALIWTDRHGAEERFSFSDIAASSARLAASLLRLGVTKGDRVIVMLPRIPEWQVAMVACLKLGAVAIPCIDMLTDKDVAYRAQRSGARAVITTAAQTAKFAGLQDSLPIRIAVGTVAGWLSFDEALTAGDTSFAPARVAAEDPAILYFTSGSTGQPKGVLHASRGIWHWRHSAIEWLDLTPDDLIWCTADTGWSKAGTSILFGPWSCGSAALFHDGPFDPRLRLELLQRHRVTVYCAAGTEIMRLLDQKIADYDLSALRRTVSAGEAVAEPAIAGWRSATGLTIAEAYGQTESLMSIGHRAEDGRRPQSMGKPLAGNRLAVIDETGRILPDGEVGELALRAPNPQLMLGYWDDPERTAACYLDGPEGCWFRTGDRAERDADGFFYHRGRGDDVINSSGYRIGPAEVEDVLLAHPAVAEVAVVGAPDDARGEIVVAYVVLRDGHEPGEAQAKALQDFAKAQTAPYKYPRAVHFIAALPKTLTGKIQRNVLRERAAREPARG